MYAGFSSTVPKKRDKDVNTIIPIITTVLKIIKIFTKSVYSVMSSVSS
jgi:hypothetical protein